MIYVLGLKSSQGRRIEVSVECVHPSAGRRVTWFEIPNKGTGTASLRKWHLHIAEGGWGLTVTEKKRPRLEVGQAKSRHKEQAQTPWGKGACVTLNNHTMQKPRTRKGQSRSSWGQRGLITQRAGFLPESAFSLQEVTQGRQSNKRCFSRIWHTFFYFYFFYFWPCQTACRILVPQTGWSNEVPCSGCMES